MKNVICVYVDLNLCTLFAEDPKPELRMVVSFNT
jgi:hypothetical protein